MRSSSILALALLLPLLASPSFGAPADDPRPIVQASEILAKIERGEPVEYDGVIIEGDLDLSGVDLPKVSAGRTIHEIGLIHLAEEAQVVNSSINITNSEIDGNVSFGNAIFYESIVFNNNNFSSDADFGEAQFHSDVSFSDAWFVEDVDFWHAKLLDDARFFGSKFCSYADFGGAQFNRVADFAEAQFCGDVRFRAIDFNDDAEFEGTEFSGYAEFDDIRFGKDANFKGTEFNKCANFLRTEFIGDADFEGAKFYGDVYFMNFALYGFEGATTPSRSSQFSGLANFKAAQFNGGDAYFRTLFGGNVDFREAVFNGVEANFERARFNDYADFQEVIFSGGDANFRDAQFNGGYVYYKRIDSSGAADFHEAVFSGGDAVFSGVQFSRGFVDFGEVEFSNTASFESTRFDRANFTLEGARNHRTLRLSDTSFENGSKICLNETDYQRLYVRWDSIEDALVYNGEVYLTLVKNFRNIEYFEDADNCYYQYRRERQSMRSFWEVAKYTDILGWVTCGYGVRPGYTLLLGLFVVLVSAVYYWRRDAIRRLKGDENESAKFSDAFYFSMMTFTTVGYGDWYPLDRHRNVVMIEGIIGWLTLSLFLVTLANVIIR